MTVFDGLPIIGNITRGQTRVDQLPEEEFTPVLQAVLNDPTIKSVAWTQYTPYFNDGDPCVFGARLRCAALANEKELDDGDDDWHDGWPPYSDEAAAVVGRMTHPNGWRNPGVYEGPDEARYMRIQALAAAIEGGAFDNVLLDKFGDHANVKVVKDDGIYVEFYEHD